MRNFIIYLVLLCFLLISKAFAQDTFEIRAKYIAKKIEAITREEKAALKTEVEDINKKLEKQIISKEEATKEKIRLSEIRSKNIETRVGVVQEELKELVQEKVEEQLQEKVDDKKEKAQLSEAMVKRMEARIGEMHAQLATLAHNGSVRKGERRTTTQLVLAAGFNNVVTNKSINNSDFGYLRSEFFEIGITLNTRILKQNNLLHFKYGISGVYNFLHPTQNRYFVVSGNQTVLEVYSKNLEKNFSYFKNVFITVPMHLEFDFSDNKIEDGKTYFRSHRSYRLGIGGFVGYNTNSKQFLKYEVDNYKIKERQKGNFNVPDWNYGLSTYVGYRAASIYFKYDLNPLFKNNIVKQNNISLGVRLDIN